MNCRFVMYAAAMTNRQPLPEMAQRISPAEAARITGLTTGHLARMSDAGKIECTRPAGSHRRYLRSEIEALVAPTNSGVELDDPQSAGAIS